MGGSSGWRFKEGEKGRARMRVGLGRDGWQSRPQGLDARTGLIHPAEIHLSLQTECKTDFSHFTYSNKVLL